jgi:1-acyl-sn-glycerol-3-phosphate acyltransferase
MSRAGAVRRAVLLPLIVSVEALLLATAPLWLAVGSVLSLVFRSTRPVRTAALVLAYAAVELRLLRRVRSADPDWDRLMRDTVDTVYRTLRRVLDVWLNLEEGSVPRVSQERPVIVLARHCGPGDSLFIAWLIEVHYGLRLHLVLKSLLRLEPTLDLAADHLPLCFIAHRGRRARDDIAALAGGLTGGDALLLFPEGGNFSWPRWRARIAALVATGAIGAPRRARARTHTLPPRHGGAVAALSAAPEADVMLLTHSGFTADGRDRPWWKLPVGRPMVVRTSLVPAQDVPREPEAAGAWLEAAWAEVDQWVARHDSTGSTE